MKVVGDDDPWSDFAPLVETPGCRVNQVLLGLDESHREAAERALNMPVGELSHMAIQRVLRGWGVSVGAGVLARHRTGTCACK